MPDKGCELTTFSCTARSFHVPNYYTLLRPQTYTL
jgi:hypothetical protein